MFGIKITPKQKAIGAGIIILSAIGYVFINRANKKKMSLEYDAIVEGATDSTGATVSPKDYEALQKSLPNATFPLKAGSKGKEVLALQRALNRVYGANLTLDGKFGDDLARALCKNVWGTCYTDIQARNYNLNKPEYNTIISK